MQIYETYRTKNVGMSWVCENLVWRYCFHIAQFPLRMSINLQLGSFGKRVVVLKTG